MNAWLLTQLTGVDGLRLSDAPDPVPGPGEAVLAIQYASLNPADRYLSEGQYPAKPPMPHILGRDAVGTVTAVGPGVAGVSVGDRRLLLRSEIGVSRPGTFAEMAAVPVESLVEPPSGWASTEAAGAPLVYLTAYQALTQWPGLPPGSVVLITGASGGVGVASTQLARAMGHTVVALLRDPAKRERLRALGATHTPDLEDASWRKALKFDLAGRRVDLAIDNIGGQQLVDVIETLGENGKVSCVGQLAGRSPVCDGDALFPATQGGRGFRRRLHRRREPGGVARRAGPVEKDRRAAAG